MENKDKVQIFIEKDEFYPGDTIEGKVILPTKQPGITYAYMKFTGRENTFFFYIPNPDNPIWCWSFQESSGYASNSSSHFARDRARNAYGKHTIFEEEVPLIEDENATSDAGVTFTFKFKIPSSAPPSTHYLDHAKIRYFMEVEYKGEIVAGKTFYIANNPSSLDSVPYDKE